MAGFDAEGFTRLLALVGGVIVIAALLSGFIERSNMPQVAVFLGLGAILGPYGLGLMDVTLQSSALRVVATLGLALVLFTDALTLSIREIRRHALLTLVVLGPGTLGLASLIGFLAWWLIGLSPPAAAMLGAALSSTDPILLRGLLRRGDIPPIGRLALRMESGLNDVVLLPVVLVAMAFVSADGQTSMVRMLMNLLLIGPGAGVLIGVVAVGALDVIRRRIGVRRDYESLYSLGVAFAAFAAAEAVHGSGFLAAFAAGLTISSLDVDLCDCFLEYGETTAELLLLFSFVLLGSSLIWSGFDSATGMTLLFAFLALFARPLVMLPSLAGIKMDRQSRLLIGFFGPRGLSSLLLILVPVFAGKADSSLFSVCSLVVILSVALHGGSLMFLRDDSKLEKPTASEPTGDDVRITVKQVEELRRDGEDVHLVDVRSEQAYGKSDEAIAGTIRLSPERAARDAKEQAIPKSLWLALFCT